MRREALGSREGNERQPGSQGRRRTETPFECEFFARSVESLLSIPAPGDSGVLDDGGEELQGFHHLVPGVTEAGEGVDLHGELAREHVVDRVLSASCHPHERGALIPRVGEPLDEAARLQPLQFLFGALAAPLVGAIGLSGLMPMVLVMLASMLLAVVATVLGVQPRRGHGETEATPGAPS